MKGAQMPKIAGLEHWEISFDAAGKLAGGDSEAAIAEPAAAGMTDLLVFSHGWNNDTDVARGLYERFFTLVAEILDDRGVDLDKVGTLGVLWPSMRWPDEDPGTGRGGAASAAGKVSDADLVDALRDAFPGAAQQKALGELARLLRERPEDPKALAAFQTHMRTLAEADPPSPTGEDGGENALLDDDAEAVFDRMAAAAPTPRSGGAAGFGGFTRLWNGAKEALRQLTYWQMKARAGVVGQTGLGPLLGRLHAAAPDLRIHLLGHSFGGRVVAFSLAGLPDAAVRDTPIASLSLIQAAFSHFSFADELPHDRKRGGALAGMQQRVGGPILVTHTLRDSAVGTAYPMASLAGRQDAAGADDLLYRWGALGHDGAQAVPADAAPLRAVGSAYDLGPGRFLNLDANKIIVNGGPPAGAHSDIFHPELAWAVLIAGGLVQP